MKTETRVKRRDNALAKLVNQEPIRFIDATPNEEYPLRILKAYRQQCDCRWVESTDGSEPTNPLLKLMNELNEQRAAILDKAIAWFYIKPKQD